jgi:lysophospholipase L1-like esterase
MAGFGSFVAMGDSFTEGVGDPRADGRGCRGWADRFAQRLDRHQPGLRYANLGIRGKLLGQVLAEQVPVAVGMGPDLVSLAAGGNDLLRPRADPDSLARSFDEVVRTLLMSGSQVLIFTGFDPRFPVLRLLRGKVAVFNAHLRAIADRHGCHVVDLWTMDVLADRRAWSADRLHLTPDAHQRVALLVCEVMGIPVDEDWRAPWPPETVLSSGTRAWLSARRMDLHWAGAHAAPWVARRIRGISTGDGLPPKRPDLLPLRPGA